MCMPPSKELIQDKVYPGCSFRVGFTVLAFAVTPPQVTSHTIAKYLGDYDTGIQGTYITQGKGNKNRCALSATTKKVSETIKNNFNSCNPYTMTFPTALFNPKFPVRTTLTGL